MLEVFRQGHDDICWLTLLKSSLLPVLMFFVTCYFTLSRYLGIVSFLSYQDFTTTQIIQLKSQPNIHLTLLSHSFSHSNTFKYLILLLLSITLIQFNLNWHSHSDLISFRCNFYSSLTSSISFNCYCLPSEISSLTSCFHPFSSLLSFVYQSTLTYDVLLVSQSVVSLKHLDVSQASVSTLPLALNFLVWDFLINFSELNSSIDSFVIGTF